MIKCNEATSICDKSQYNEASFFDKLRLSLHNFLCHRCKLYTEQNKIMTKILKTHTHKHQEQKLNSKEKEKLQEALDNELNKLD